MSQCFLCNATSDHIVWHEGEFEGRLCTCGLLYTHPEPLAGAIDYSVDSHPAEFYSLSANFRADWMSLHCPKGKLVEIGCGDGFFLSAAKCRGYEVLGLEPHPERAQNVKAHFGIQVEQGFLDNNKLPTGSFDVVYHCDLLAHFPDPIGSLRAMSTLLRPGGVLCFEVGLLSGISPVWYRLIRHLGLGPHLWLYSEQSLDAILVRADLRLEHIQYFGLAPATILGKTASLLINRTILPLLSKTRFLTPSGTSHKVQALYHRFTNFFRYRVGRHSPRIGPQTLFLVVRPTTYVGIHYGDHSASK